MSNPNFDALFSAILLSPLHQFIIIPIGGRLRRRYFIDKAEEKERKMQIFELVLSIEQCPRKKNEFLIILGTEQKSPHLRRKQRDLFFVILHLYLI
jgi:hypothetical protein